MFVVDLTFLFCISSDTKIKILYTIIYNTRETLDFLLKNELFLYCRWNE